MRLFLGSALAAPLMLVAVVVLLVSALFPIGSQATPSDHALHEIPTFVLVVYQQAVHERCPALPWAVLAAVGQVESDHGQYGGARLQPDGRLSPPIIGVALDGSPGLARVSDTDAGRWDEDRLWDRAVGPMQFIPATWRAYGVDASGDGSADPHNLYDSVHAAARYLCAMGASEPGRLRQALLGYNRSDAYVNGVLELAARYTALNATAVASADLVTAVLTNPRLNIYAGGRRDIAQGIIDPRVLALLQSLSQRHIIVVSSLKTGHSRCVGGGDRPGCRVSEHWNGRAVDIAMIDGRRVDQSNRDAYAIVTWLAGLEGPLRPSQVGSPWDDFSRLAGFFSDAAHQGHLHIGYTVNPR